MTFTFFPRILKHLICFSLFIGQRVLGLEPLRIGLDGLAYFMNGLTRKAKLTSHGCRWFSLADPSQQQNDLRWPEVLLCEHRPTVQIVDPLTAFAPIDGHLALPGCAEYSCLLHALSAMWTVQLALMEVLQQPCGTQIIIEQVYDWEVHG